MNLIKSLALILVITATTSCAFSVYDVNVDYKYTGDSRLPDNSSNVIIGEFVDARSVTNERMIMNQRNLYGDTTSGGWQAEKPLAEIVRDAVKQVFANQSQLQAKRLELTGELVDFSAEVIMGFWSGEYKGRLTQKFQLRNPENGEIVWRDTFTGIATVPGKEKPAGLFRACLDQLMITFIKDEYFLQQLSKD